MMCLYLIWELVIPSDASAQFAFQIEMTAPQSGMAVQGLVPVIGTASVNGFASYQLEFSLTDNLSDTWFVIVSSNVPVENDILGEWNTNSLTDGIYRLRLIVQRAGDDPVIVFVEGLRVRNYSPVETDTPGPTSTPIPGQAATPTETIAPATPTSFPDNQAQLSTNKIRSVFIAGILSGITIFIFLGLYIVTKNRKSRT